MQFRNISEGKLKVGNNKCEPTDISKKPMWFQRDALFKWFYSAHVIANNPSAEDISKRHMLGW